MTTAQAIWLGIVQGLTEFLPVSSSGHLAIIQRLMGLKPDMVFTLGVHLGTALSVLAVYGREALEVLTGFFRGIARRDGGSKLALCLVITAIPAAVVGFAAGDTVEAAFTSPLFIGVGWAVTGIILWCADRSLARRSGLYRGVNAKTVRYGHAAAVGIGQAFAVFPGVSRSGTTMSTAIGLGFDRSFAAAYSFLSSLPVILGAVILWPLSSGAQITAADIRPLIIGTVVSFASGALAINLFRRTVQAGRLRLFSIYLWIIGSASILWGIKGLFLSR